MLSSDRVHDIENDAVHTIIQVNGSSPKTPPSYHHNYESSPETRSTTSTVSGSSPAPRAVSADVSRRSRTSCVSLSTDSINRLHRTSNLFQLHPETARTAEQKQKSLSIESLTKVPEKEKGNRFVRKVSTSFRLRKNLLETDGEEKKSKEENKKKSSVTTSPEQISSFLEKMATRSLPQSPRTDRKAKLYSSLNSTTEKVSNALSWLPSKSSKRLMKNKSATHDLSTSLISYTPASTSTQGVIASNENLELLCSTSTSGIPIYLEKCIEFIENNGGFEQEGLYRVPGNQTHLAEVEKRFLKSGEFDVSSFDTPVHVAATALKSFFSCLPESLIPTDYHSRWKQVMMAADDKEKIDGIREALSHLPHSNQTVLRYLVKHLAIVSCSPKTVMNSNNLSKVWTPTLFRSSLENDRPSILAPSFTTSGIQLLTKPDITNRSRRQKAVNSNIRNRVTRTDSLIMSHFYSSPIEIQPAPLATPEAVDFSPAYSLVNDAVHTIIQVNGSSPKTATSYHHNYESSPETRSTTSTVSGSSPAPRAVSADVSRRSRTSCVSLSTDSINRLHRTSNLFQLHPETAMTAEQKQKSLSIESLTKVPEKEKGNRFVRKVATSFRLRKNLLETDGEEKKSKEENKKKSSVTTSPEQISSFLEKMATRSLPHSPRTDRKAKFYSSLNCTTEKVSNVLSWFPSKSSKRLMKNKSATHDLSTSLISYTPASTSTQGVIASNENLELLCSTSTSGIPVYLEKCIQFIENNGGFEQEGLYRVPGNQTHLAEVEKRFLKSGEFDVSSFDTPVHVAATALKTFFSCLPESLIPTDYHSRWKQVMIAADDKENGGFEQEGLYRVPGNQTHLAEVEKRFLKSGEFDVSSFDTPVHVAATALKTFFSCLPESLIPTDYHSRWKQVMIAADDKEKIDGIREALSQLPHSNQTVLRPVFTSYQELSSGIIAFQLALELLIINSDSLFSLNTLL
ncbi:hypothetical protein GCK72_013137 [Caenorhabditis remanei]|uniref:Rho-GAP domain-containing protein n=1 Tax=Caenorhabditis remanei TaxID=31234 RepID=A0A6A5GQ12_CAERE|nr:hypothetical protein GCK72_013137 [Caenorhabditis remanei]KAF1756683.1 hypothetical protein GCK72_013137 [Caenorhabditis remanei]